MNFIYENYFLYIMNKRTQIHIIAFDAFIMKDQGLIW